MEYVMMIVVREVCCLNSNGIRSWLIISHSLSYWCMNQSVPISWLYFRNIPSEWWSSLISPPHKSSLIRLFFLANSYTILSHLWSILSHICFSRQWLMVKVAPGLSLCFHYPFWKLTIWFLANCVWIWWVCPHNWYRCCNSIICSV